jgi:signal transduction histidine kinase
MTVTSVELVTRRPRYQDLLVDWAPSVVLSAVAAHELLYNHAGPLDWILGQCLVWVLVVRRRAPTPVLGVALALATTAWLDGTLLVSHLGVLVALHAVAVRAGRLHALAAAAVVEAAAIAVAFEFSPTGSVNDGVVLLTGLTSSALLLGTTQRAQQHYLTALEGRTEQLERERSIRAEMAAGEERTRIAREIHDIVAHSVSVMIALSEGAAAAGEGASSRGAMRQVAATGRQALEELRRVLMVLHRTETTAQGQDDPRRPQPTVASLPALVDDVRAAGLEVTLEVAGPAETLEPGLQATIFRIVQEALTNTLKHAESVARSTVLVQVEPDDVLVHVGDDGSSAAPPASPVPGAGNGVRGMRERAEMYAGSLVSEAGPDGWIVTCRLSRHLAATR